MHALCDHQIIPLGTEVMALVDNGTGENIVTASRRGCCGELLWQIEAKDTEAVNVGERGEAIDTMIEIALSMLPGDGYSTLIPHGLRDLP